MSDIKGNEREVHVGVQETREYIMYEEVEVKGKELAMSIRLKPRCAGKKYTGGMCNLSLNQSSNMK